MPGQSNSENRFKVTRAENTLPRISDSDTLIDYGPNKDAKLEGANGWQPSGQF
jgi:hypothetical protein